MIDDPLNSPGNSSNLQNLISPNSLSNGLFGFELGSGDALIPDESSLLGENLQAPSSSSSSLNRNSLVESIPLMENGEIDRNARIEQLMKTSKRKQGKPRAQRRPPIGGKWTPDEDTRLRSIVEENGPRNWKRIAELLGPTRTDVQCLHRWNKVLKPGLHKGPWTGMLLLISLSLLSLSLLSLLLLLLLLLILTPPSSIPLLLPLPPLLLQSKKMP